MKRVRTQRKPAGGASAGAGRSSTTTAATRRERTSEAATAGPTVDVSSRDPRGLFALQRVIGNQAIGAMLREPQASASQATAGPATVARKLDAPASSATQHIGPQRPAPREPQSGLLRRLAASGQNQAVQSLARRNGSRAPAGKRNPVRETTTASQPQIQRLVMSNQQWKSKSASKSLPIRSRKLLLIDLKLMEYNAAQQKALKVRLVALGALEKVIDKWMKSKDVRQTKGHGRGQVPQPPRQGHEQRRIKSPRVAAVRALRKQVRSEKTALDALDIGKVANDAGVQTVARAIYRRAVRLAQNSVAKRGSVKDLLKDLTQAMDDAKELAKQQKALNLEGPADALVEALKGFTRIAGGKKPADLTAKKPSDFVEMVKTDLARLHAIAKAARKEPESKDAFVEGNVAEFAGQYAETSEAFTDIEGLREGTGGKGNEGFSELGGALGATETNDTDSGVYDMESAVAGGAVTVLSYLRARQTLKQRPKAPPAERRAAKATIAQAGPEIIAKAMQLSGGAATLHKGRGKKIAGSAKFKKEGTDVSTDLKFAGDIFGVVGGFLGTIKKLFDLVMHHSDKTDKQRVESERKGYESLGQTLKKTVGLITSALNTTKKAMKLGYQVGGGGQAATDTISTAAKDFMGKGVPLVNMIKALVDTGQLSYKLWRFGKRRSALAKRIKKLMTKSGTDLAVVEVVEAAHSTLGKRISRAGIDLGHALLAVVAAGFNTSGIGLAPGMIIGLASSAAKLGQFTGRTVKQKLRNVWARKRERREGKQGKGGKYKDKHYAETYEHFKARKRYEAGKGKVARLGVAFKLTFMLNWDKSGKKKKQDTTAVALEMLRMNDKAIFKAVGVTVALKGAKGDAAKRLKIVVDALNKRG